MFKEQRPVGFPAHVPCLSGGGMISVRGYLISVILIFLALAAAAAVVNAAEAREIQLVDGSVITGEVVSLSGGIYTVRSATLGTLRIKASDIRVIRMEGSSVRSDAREQGKTLGENMPDDTEILALIHALQNDPGLQKMLQDPGIVKAMQAGDIAALMRNPEFTKLLDKYRGQDINKSPAR